MEKQRNSCDILHIICNMSPYYRNKFTFNVTPKVLELVHSPFRKLTKYMFGAIATKMNKGGEMFRN